MNLIESFVVYVLEFVVYSLKIMCKIFFVIAFVLWSFAYYNW